MRKYKYLLLLPISICNCNGCNTQTDKKEDKQDKIPGIRKLINDINKYIKHPSPKSITLDSIINDLQKYTIDNSLDIDKIINEITTLRDNKKCTFNEKQKSSLNNSINHLNNAKKEAKRNKKKYNNLLNKAINELNQVKNENKDNKNKEEIDNELDNVKKDIENIMDNKEELLKLKNKLEGLKNDEKNNKRKIDVLLNKVKGRLKELDKDKEKKEYKPKEKDDKHDKPDKKDDEPDKKDDKPDKKKDKPDKKKKDDDIVNRYKKIIENKGKYFSSKSLGDKCITNNFYQSGYIIRPTQEVYRIVYDNSSGEGIPLEGEQFFNFGIYQYWDKIKDKINKTPNLQGLFNNEGKAIVQRDDGTINHKFFLFCAYHNAMKGNYLWDNYTLLNPDAPGYKTTLGYKPLKKFIKDDISCHSFNFIPKVLDDIIRKYWMDQMKDIKTIPQLIEFLKQQKDNSIPNYDRVYYDRPANENDLTDPNVRPDDENIFKNHEIENYILSDKINEILKSYPNYEFTEDEVLTIAEKTNVEESEILTLVENEQFKSKFEEIRKLAEKS